MQTNVTQVRSKSNILPENDIQMSFDEKGQAKLAAIFIDLYSDLTSAIIREYCANAMDSHNKSGQSLPIEVTLPTADEQTFKVKDYGVGMSLDDIVDVYSKYGSSTKDMENDSIGSYGLGCKSALSISPSFTVVAIKDGSKTVAIVSREENSLGRIRIVTTLETHEPNGVEIAIPINVTPREFADKASRIFFTWPKNSVLVDGKLPAVTMHNKDHFIPLSNNSFLTREVDPRDRQKSGVSPYSGLVVNMGGIGYPVDYDTYNTIIRDAEKRLSFSINFLRDRTWVVSVPLGGVDLIPNREGLRWSPRSYRAVTDYLVASARSLVKYVESSLDKAKSRSEILTNKTHLLVSQFTPLLSSAVKWKGEDLPANIPFSTLAFKSDEISENLILPTYNGKYSRRGMRYRIDFSFGFSDRAYRNFGEITKENGEHDNKVKWIFVNTNKAKLSTSEATSLVNSYMKMIKSTISTNFVYVVDNVLSENLWLRTVIDDGHYEVKEIDLATMQTMIAEFKKNEAKKARDRAKGNDPIYPILMSVNKKWSWWDMGLSKIEKHVAKNPKTVVYADETVFLQETFDSYQNITNFLPENVIIVRMKGSRNVASFVKKTNLDVKTNLEAAITESIEKVISSIPLKDYFITTHVPSTFSNSAECLQLEDGFIKDALSAVGGKRLNNGTPYTPSHTVPSYMISSLRNILSHFPMIEAPKHDVGIKAQQIFDLLPLFFEADTPYAIDSKSDAYKAALSAYINGHADTIESIVNS